LTWLTIGAGVVLGLLVPPLIGQAHTRASVVSLLGVAGALLLVGAWSGWRGRSRPAGRHRGVQICWGGALLLLAVGRGATAHPLDPAPWREATRGADAGVRTVVVVEASKPSGRCELLVAAADAGRVGPALLLSAPAAVCPRAAGDEVLIQTDALVMRTAASLPGGVAPSGRAGSAGAVSVAFADGVWPGAPGVGWVASGSRAVAHLRQAAWDASRGDDAAAFVVASALGLRRALHPQRRHELRVAGLGHLVAVSGLHVGIAAWLVARLFLRVGTLVHGTAAFGLASAAVFIAGYVALAGAPPSAVRAGIMAVLVALGDALGRPAHGMVVLAATSAVMLVVRPAWAFDPGFQLSLVAMAVIVRSPRGAGLLATTWRVTWAVVPVALLHFGRAGAYALVTNVVAVPLLTLWTLPVGLLGVLMVPWFGASALAPAGWGATAILDLAHMVAGWPGVSATLLAGVALVSFALSCGLAFVGPARAASWVRAFRAGAVPPVAALATIIVVWLPRPSADAAPALQWAAIGSAQRFSVVVAGARPGQACITDSVLSGSRWPPVLEALGVDAVVGLAPAAGAPGDAPHLVELAESLRAAELLSAQTQACVDPPRTQVTGALGYCRRVGRQRPAVALVDTDGQEFCWIHGRWSPREFPRVQPLPHLSPHDVE